MFEKMLLNQLSEKLGRKIEADTCKMNQMTGEIEIRNLRVYNESGTQIQITLESGTATLDIADLIQQKFTIKHAQVDSLHITR